MKVASFVFTIFSLGIMSGATAQAQDNPVYPANSGAVSYAELDNLPDWRGLWFPFFGQVSGDEVVLIGEAKEIWDMHQARRATDSTYEIPEGANNCEPDGMPGFMTFPYSLEFLFTPGKVTVVQEALMQVRRIFTDGRPLPTREELDPDYFGYSVAHWDGDTLVVTTIGTQTGQRMSIAGITNSDQFTITEHIFLDPENEDILNVNFTYEDPNVLAQPWHRNHRFRRDRSWEQIEYIYSQNDRHFFDEEGQTLVPDEIRN